MKIRKYFFIIFTIVFAGFQFIPIDKNQKTEGSSQDFVNIFNPPNHIEKLLKIACYDCHSNSTNYPWYSCIQPIGLILENHIKKGKLDLNFSEFGLYSSRKQKSKMRSISSQIRDNEMPPREFTVVHKEARLSVSDQKDIINWMIDLRKRNN